MAKKQSAGLLLYKFLTNEIFVLLVHPGGPFWKNKDAGAWSIPKGEYENDEEPLAAAIRETEEELGKRFSGNFLPLGSVKLKSGKEIKAWALEAEFDPAKLKSNEFSFEWPPASGKKIMIPEVDKAAWLSLSEATEKINAGQIPLLDRLGEIVPEN